MALSECILITGGASGIGRAWVCGFLEDGCTVVAADISKASLAQLEPHPRLHTFVCDVADAQQVKRMIEFAVSCMGRLDVLFNNAGMGYSTRVEDAKDNQFENHVAVHLFCCANGMRFAIPIMRKQGRGRIVNTISRDAESSRPRLSAYAAAKAGMWSLSRAAALEVADTDILVNMLFPGPTATGIFRRKIQIMALFQSFLIYKLRIKLTPVPGSLQPYRKMALLERCLHQWPTMENMKCSRVGVILCRRQSLDVAKNTNPSCDEHACLTMEVKSKVMIQPQDGLML